MNKRFLIYTIIFIAILSGACKHKNSKDYANLDPALATLCQQIDKHPNDPELYFQRANYYYGKAVIDSALQDIMQSIKLDSTQAKYWLTLSDLYFAQRETDLTEETLEKVITMDPDNNEARLKLAELYYHLKMYPQCNETLDEAIAKRNHNPRAHLIRAFCLKDQADTVGAIRMLQLVIDQDPTEVKAFLELGYLYQLKKNPLAATYYQNALQVDPNNIEINYNLAMLYQELGEYEKAIEQYKILLSIDAKNKHALHNIGYIYLNYLGNYEEAVNFFSKAIEADPNFINAICNRGVAYENLGRNEEARKDYLRCKEISANFEPAVAGLNRLDRR